MGSSERDVDLPTPAAATVDRVARREHALALGRERRHANREKLLRRERDLDPPSSPLVEGLKVLLATAFFVPLLWPIGILVRRTNRYWGSVAAGLVAVVCAIWLGAVLYNGPRLLRACARDLRGALGGWKRDPKTLAWLLLVLIGVPLIVMFGTMHWRSL